MGMRDSCVSGFEDFDFPKTEIPFLGFLVGEWTADEFGRGVLPRLMDGGAALSDVLAVGETGCSAEDPTSVCAVERAGFGGWVEELRGGQGVVGEVVDGFVGRWRVG